MKILLLTHFFPPEIGPAQGRLLETAIDLKSAGHDVLVLTTFPNYPSGIVPPQYRGKRFLREEIEGIPVVRSWLYTSEGRGTAGRSASHLSFAASSLLAGLRLGFRPDVVAVDMHPIFLCVSALVLGRLWRAPYVLNACDLIPEQAVAYGVVSNPLVISVTRWLARVVCANATMIVPFTAGILGMLEERGIPSARMRLIYYGVDQDLFDDRSRWQALPDGFPSRDDAEFVVTYAGNLGPAYALDAVVEAARMIEDEGEAGTRFWFVGDGSERAHLEDRVHALGLKNVTFTGQIPRRSMPALYEQSDICLVSLRQAEFVRRAALSSKVFEGMAAGIPIVVVGEGETADLVLEAGAGLVVPSAQSERLARVLMDLRKAPERRREMGLNGRRFAAHRFTRALRSSQYEATLSRALSRPDRESSLLGKGEVG